MKKRVRQTGRIPLGGLSVEQLMAAYAEYKESSNVVDKILAHEAAKRAAFQRPDSYSVSALASSIRHAPDLERKECVCLVAELLSAFGPRTGLPALVSIAAMLVDESLVASAEAVLSEVERRSPGNRNAQMVRARIASTRGDRIDAEYLASQAFAPGRSAARSGARSAGFEEQLADRLIRVLGSR